MIRKRKIIILLMITLFIFSGSVFSVIFPAYIRKSHINNKSSSLSNKSIVVEEIDISKINLININAPTKKQNVKHSNTPNANDFNPPFLKGVSFRFINASLVDDRGSSIVTYEAFNSVKKSPQRTKFLFSVSGFQSKASAKIEKANQQMDVLTKAKIIIKPFKHPEKIVEYMTRPNSDDVTFPVYSGFKFSFIVATPVDEDGTSHLTYQAKVNPYVLGSKTKNFMFILNEFQTKNELLAKLNRDVDNLKLSDIEDLPTKKQNVNHGDIPTSENINVPSKSEYVFTFKSATNVDDNGFADVIYTTTKDKIEGVRSKDMEFEVGGFETKAQAVRKAEIIQEANEKIDSLSIDSVTPPIVKNPGYYYSENNFTPPTKDEFIFKYISSTQKKTQDLSDGIRYVTYEVDVFPQIEGTQTKIMEFKVSGFNKIKSEDLYLYAGNRIIGPIPKKILSFRSIPTADDLFSPFLIGSTFEFISASSINENGISEIKYWKITGDKTKEVEIFQVSGFQTKAMFDASKQKTVKDWNDKIKAVTHKTLEKLPHIVWRTNEKGKRVVDDIKPPVQKGFKFKFIEKSEVRTFFSAKFRPYYMYVDTVIYSTFEVYTTEVKGAIKKILKFLNYREKLQKEYELELKKFDRTKVTPPTLKSKILKNGKPDYTNFTHPVSPPEMLYLVYKEATPVDKEGKTEVTYKIAISFPNYSDASREIKFTVSGFND